MSAPATTGRDAAFEEEALGRVVDTWLIRRLWHYVRPYTGQVALTLTLVFPVFAFELAPAWIVKTGLDRVFVSPESASAAQTFWIDAYLDAPSGIAPLNWLAVLYLVAMLGGAALQFTKMLVMARTGQSAMRDLRRDVFAHIQRLHLGFFDTIPVGRLVTRATNDVENVAEMFSAGIVALVTDILTMIGFAVVLFLIEPDLAPYAFLVVPLLAVAAVVFRLKVREAFRLVRVRIARINAYVQESVTGMKVVQLFNREARNSEEFDAMNADHRDAWFQSIRYDSALFAVVELAQGITIAIIIWQATGIAEAGTVYLFMDYMRRFFMPLRDLSAKYSVMQSAMASSERIFQLLDTQPAVRDPAVLDTSLPARASDTAPVVAFENVSFAYQGEDWVLRDLSIQVRQGEKVAIVGPTGSGKTTIIKLISRLYDVTEGRIELDGVPLRELAQEQLRRRVATVLQDVFLFSGTIAENVALDRPDVDRATVERVCRAVQAHKFIERLPDGYDTEIRERGSNLSAGQRQLLSFARALAHGADVVILDEATSSIDTETESLVQEGIHALMEGKTAIAIAHRLSTIRDVDRIYVLQQGQLVESGSHEELLALRGAYERLYRIQYAAQEPSPARRDPPPARPAA